MGRAHSLSRAQAAATTQLRPSFSLSPPGGPPQGDLIDDATVPNLSHTQSKPNLPRIQTENSFDLTNPSQIPLTHINPPSSSPFPLKNIHLRAARLLVFVLTVPPLPPPSSSNSGAPRRHRALPLYHLSSLCSAHLPDLFLVLQINASVRDPRPPPRELLQLATWEGGECARDPRPLHQARLDVRKLVVTEPSRTPLPA